MSTKRFNLIHFESKSFKKTHLFANEKITPELAHDLLTLNSDNRPISNSFVKRYSSDMTNGKWTFVGDIIGISNEGKLLNGQHRLMAVIDSGTTQVFHIQTGLDPQAFNKMDIGKLRTAGDTLAIKGFANYSTVSAIVRYVSVYNAKLLDDYLNTKKIKFSNQDISDEADKLNRVLLQKSATAASRFYGRFRFMDPSTIGPLVYIFSKINEENALNFFDLLSSGDGVSSNSYSSIFLLRNKLISSMSSGSKITIRHRWVIIIKAWNFYRTNKVMKSLSYSENDEIPKPI